MINLVIHSAELFACVRSHHLIRFCLAFSLSSELFGTLCQGDALLQGLAYLTIILQLAHGSVDRVVAFMLRLLIGHVHFHRCHVMPVNGVRVGAVSVWLCINVRGNWLAFIMN